MKIGAENKKEVIVMVILLAIGIPLAIYSFSSQGTSSAAPPAVNPSNTPAAGTRPQRKSQIEDIKLDPRLRLDILQDSQKVKYEGGSRNIFQMGAPPPEKLAASVRTTPTPGPPTPTPTPPPPPINVVFYGFATTKPGEPRKIFLAQGGTVYVVKQGDIIARQYKVVQIMSNSVLVEDVLHNNRQQIPLTSR